MATIVNVPQAAGVPAVNFAPAAVAPVLLTQDLVSQFSAVFGPQWGIFQGGVPVITAESVIGFDFRNDWTISDYPVEGGIFESYDKVLQPFLAKVQFASGSSPTAREALLASIAAIAPTLTIVDVVTPEFTYSSANISHYDYRRKSSQGVGLVVVDVWLTQVIQQNTGVLGASQVQNPASADAQSNGTVQAQNPPVSGGGNLPAFQ